MRTGSPSQVTVSCPHLHVAVRSIDTKYINLCHLRRTQTDRFAVSSKSGGKVRNVRRRHTDKTAQYGVGGFRLTTCLSCSIALVSPRCTSQIIGLCRVHALPGFAQSGSLIHCQQGYFGRTGNGVVPHGPFKPMPYPQAYAYPELSRPE